MTTLSNRVDLEMYYAMNHYHMRNIVNIDGIFYYVDPLWIDIQDNAIKYLINA